MINQYDFLLFCHFTCFPRWASWVWLSTATGAYYWLWLCRIYGQANYSSPQDFWCSVA